MYSLTTELPETGKYLFNDGLMDQVMNKTDNMTDYRNKDASRMEPAKRGWVNGILGSRTKNWSVAGPNTPNDGKTQCHMGFSSGSLFPARDERLGGVCRTKPPC